jgi:hypothetical protein
MSDEPPEWRGRGPRDRQGWPNRTFEATPGGPRSHRGTGGPFERRTEWTGIQQPPPGTEQRISDTAEFRPSRAPYEDEMPTEEIREAPAVQTPPVRGRPIIRPHFVLEREPDALYRLNAWLSVAVRIFGIIALLATLWLLGLCLSHGGVPLWVRS